MSTGNFKQHLPVQYPEELLALYLGQKFFCYANVSEGHIVLVGRNALKRMTELE